MVVTYNLTKMVGGWFIGPFDPSLLKTEEFECAVKRYIAGDKESAHVHRIATEYTVIVEGSVRMNGIVYGRNTIIEIPPGEETDFEALTDTISFVVKVPGVRGDKYVVENA